MLLTTTLVSVETAQVLAQFVPNVRSTPSRQRPKLWRQLSPISSCPMVPLSHGDGSSHHDTIWHIPHLLPRHQCGSAVRLSYSPTPRCGEKIPRLEKSRALGSMYQRLPLYTPSRSATPHHSRDTTLPNHPRDGHADAKVEARRYVFSPTAPGRRCSLSGTDCCLRDFSRTPRLTISCSRLPTAPDAEPC